MGKINNQNIEYYYKNCFESIEPNMMPKYSLTYAPNLINLYITNELYNGLVTNYGRDALPITPPSLIILCLTFSYYI